MVVFPNAKINIGLNIIEKREDGFHNIESIFYPIPWCDILEINPANTFNFSTSGIPIQGKTENNLVIKAFELLKQNYNIPNVNIHLHKQIPMGAGLGGGSSDASFTLAALNTLFELNVPIKKLEEFADTLGSDCPFFIENTPKYVTGKGEIMCDTNLNLSGYYIKLVNPNIHISTAEAFDGIIPKNKINSLSKVSLTAIKQHNKIVINDFEATVFPKHPILVDIKNELINEGAFFTSMTGTGSTIYGIFKTEPKLSFDQFTEKIIQL